MILKSPSFLLDIGLLLYLKHLW